MIMGLLKGVPHALGLFTAGFYAVFKVGNFKRVNEVTFTLVSPMTATSRTPDKRMNAL